MVADSLRVLAVEPWLGGSHAAFLGAWRRRSRLCVDVRGLAPRHWRWRMRGGTWQLARELEREPPPDALLVSDFVDLPGLVGLLPPAWSAVPSVAYFHENQLAYPGREREEPDARDLHPAFTNVLTCLRADRLVFNSRFHREAFRAAADAWLARLPRPAPRAELARALERAEVVPPGVELDRLPLGPGAPAGSPLRVAFNHRWEHDKDPLAFLRAARAVPDLELVLLGETFERLPEGAPELLEALAPRTLHRGWVADRAEYARRLGACDVALSTARQEFYGIAAVEGLAVGCHPLLPRRLAYPELLPGALHGTHLHGDGDDLVRRLTALARAPEALRDPARRAAHRALAAEGHDAAATAAALDRICEDAVRSPPRRAPRARERDAGAP